MHVCVVQYDDRPASSLGDMGDLMEHNRRVCEADGNCSYLRFTHTARDRPAYWEKVALVRRTLRDNPGCDAVVWLDSDAAVHQTQSFDRFRLLLDGADGAYSDDPDPSQHRMNAGVFAFRNSEEGRRLVDAWDAGWEGESHRFWSRNAETGEWTCRGAKDGGCRWGQRHYEQGSFSRVEEAASSLPGAVPHASNLLPPRDDVDEDGGWSRATSWGRRSSTSARTSTRTTTPPPDRRRERGRKGERKRGEEEGRRRGRHSSGS